MKSRRFTAQYLPCFDRKNNTPQLRQETVALRDFGPTYVADGSWLCENSSGRTTRRISPSNCIPESQNIPSMPCSRIVFSTFRECMSFYTWGNSGIEPYSGSGNQLSKNQQGPPPGLAIMENCNGALCRTGRIAEADSDLHRRSDWKDRARRGGCIRSGDHRGIYQVACAACRAGRA
jgi:hypothetical protein